MRVCMKCGSELSTSSELDESQDDARSLAQFALAAGHAELASAITERASIRIALERAGLCLWHAIEVRDTAREGGSDASA